jgi:hypothetical protein
VITGIVVNYLPVTLKDGSATIKGYYATIQLAINAAVDGEVVEVCAGTYNENLNFAGKSLTLNGPFATTSGCDPGRGTGEAIIAGNIVVSGSALLNAVIAGFRIESGSLSAIDRSETFRWWYLQ